MHIAMYYLWDHKATRFARIGRLLQEALRETPLLIFALALRDRPRPGRASIELRK